MTPEQPEMTPEPKPPTDDEQQKKQVEFKRKRLDLKEAIPAMWRSLTDDKGKLDKVSLIGQVTLKIKEEKLPYEHELARALVDEVDRTMRPPVSKDKQGRFSFYEPESYIPIADNERRLMSKATKGDIAAWQEIEQIEFEASRVAFDRKTTWRFGILASWRENEKTLADVMKRLAREKLEDSGDHSVQ